MRSYVATPQGDYPKDKVVLFLTDVFGIPLINNRVRPRFRPQSPRPRTHVHTQQLLVDDIARNGFKTIMPDILNNDPMPEERGPDFDRNAWIAKHGPESWQGSLDAVVAALKAQGVTRIGTTGYCFGAPPAFYLAFKNESHVTVLSHPSRLAVPDDLEVCPA